jgi:hypothetical protein
MPTAAPVESTASAMEPAAPVEAPSAANRATMESANRTATGETTARKTTTSEATSAEATPIEATSGEAASAKAASEAATPADPVKPRAGADEDSPGKPTRPVISIRCARVRIVPVVTIVADRSHSNIARANAHTHADLRLRVGQWNHQNCQ